MDTRANVIELNDRLRTTFKGGRIEVCHGPYEIDDRTIGRMLCVLARYDRFERGSLHDEGTFIFGGYSVAFHIAVENGERILRVWIEQDVLNGAA